MDGPRDDRAVPPMIKTWSIGPLVVTYDRWSEHEATFRVLQFTWIGRERP